MAPRLSAQELADALDAQPNGTGWLAFCVAHNDRNTPNLHINEGEDETTLVWCSGGCSQEAVIEALRQRGITLNGRHRGGGRSIPPGSDSRPSGAGPDSASTKGSRGTSGATAGTSGATAPDCAPRIAQLTLEQYAEAFRLPLAFLQGFGLSTIRYVDGPAVRIPYLDEERNEVAVRFRLKLKKGEGDDGRFKWRSGAKACLYGRWRLEDARKEGRITIVEGESDTHTLWYHGIPAIGLPGAGNWDERRDAGRLDGIETIYVLIEPDAGGDAVLRWVDASTIRNRVRLVSLSPYKDASELYLADREGFGAAWRRAIDASEPWTTIEHVRRKAARAAAEEEAGGLLHDPQLMDRIADAMRALGYAGELRPAQTIYLAMTSRLLPRPVNVNIVAPSAAGKNRTVDAALRLMPQEAYYRLTASSQRALVYSEESFKHRAIVVEEADSIPEDGPAASAIRSIADSNEMRYDVVERDPVTNRWGVRHIVKEGPTALVTTATRSARDQMGTRLLETSLLDTEDQTREVMRKAAAEASGEDVPPPDIDRLVAVQRFLAAADSHTVVVPFAGYLAEKVPARDVRMRRDFRKLISLIQASALLYQCQRMRTDDGAILAQPDDYAVAHELLSPVFNALASSGVTPAIRETVLAVEPHEEINQIELAKRLSISPSAARWRMNRALKGGWLVNLEERRGRPVKLVRGLELPEEEQSLPSREDVEAWTRSCAATGRNSGTSGAGASADAKNEGRRYGASDCRVDDAPPPPSSEDDGAIYVASGEHYPCGGCGGSDANCWWDGSGRVCLREVGA